MGASAEAAMPRLLVFLLASDVTTPGRPSGGSPSCWCSRAERG